VVPEVPGGPARGAAELARRHRHSRGASRAARGYTHTTPRHTRQMLTRVCTCKVDLTRHEAWLHTGRAIAGLCRPSRVCGCAACMACVRQRRAGPGRGAPVGQPFAAPYPSSSPSCRMPPLRLAPLSPCASCRRAPCRRRCALLSCCCLAVRGDQGGSNGRWAAPSWPVPSSCVDPDAIADCRFVGRGDAILVGRTNWRRQVGENCLIVH